MRGWLAGPGRPNIGIGHQSGWRRPGAFVRRFAGGKGRRPRLGHRRRGAVARAGREGHGDVGDFGDFGGFGGFEGFGAGPRGGWAGVVWWGPAACCSGVVSCLISCSARSAGVRRVETGMRGQGRTTRAGQGNDACGELWVLRELTRCRVQDELRGGYRLLIYMVGVRAKILGHTHTTATQG